VSFSTGFTLVAPASGNVIVSSTAGTFDGQLALFADTATCGDFTTFGLVAANDDAPIGSLAPELSACGLTPGNTYYVMHDSWSTSSVATNYAVQISEVLLDAGADGTASVCASDSVDLNSIATIADATGAWSFDLNPNTIVNDSLFNASSVPSGTHIATYYVSMGCAMDSAVATLTIVTPGQSGTAISPCTMCTAGDVFLPNGITGTVESGGTWSDDSGTGLLLGTNNNVFAATGIPVGTYPFTYTVSNGVCPDASTTLSVTLTTCTSVEENELSFTVYPNPNEGIFNITSNVSEVVSITIMDVQGKVVYNNKVSITGGTPKVISMDNVETGMYILNIASDSNVSTQSFIIK
jgi:hypothetical protein